MDITRAERALWASFRKVAASAPLAPTPRFAEGVHPAVGQINEPGFYGTFAPGGRADLLEPLFKPFGEAGMSVYRHLPRLRLFDSVVGGGVGAAGGLGVNAVRNLFRSEEEKRKDPGYGRAAALGALAGAGAGNVIGDRARRYVSNAITPALYNTDQSMLDRLLPRNAQDVWQGAVADKPLSRDLPASLDRTTVDARRELVRRELGVHTNNPASDIWARNQDGSFSINPAHPGQGTLRSALVGDLSNPAGAAAAANIGIPAGPMSPVVGGQSVAQFPLPGGANLYHSRDRWDYTLAPHESDYLYRGLGRALTDRAWRDQPAPAGVLDAYSRGHALTNQQHLSTLGARELMDRLAVWERPWLSHYVSDTPPATPGAPRGLQLLTGEGRAYPDR